MDPRLFKHLLCRE